MKYVIGTRGSRLALIQTTYVMERLQNAFPQHQFEYKIIKTKGDQNQDTPLHQIGGVGVFVKTIEEQLLRGEIDMAVHSMKDMPSILPAGLCLCDAWKQEDPRDVFIQNPKRSHLAITVVATGSIRRQVLLKQQDASIDCVGIRGNVDRRIQIMNEKELDGLVLAAAGLHRLHMQDRITKYYDPTTFIPACTQGVLAIEVRDTDCELRAMIETFKDEDTMLRVRAERAFLATMGKGCQSPLGAYLQVHKEDVCLYGMLGNGDGTFLVKDEIQGTREDVEEMGVTLASRLLEKVEHHG